MKVAARMGSEIGADFIKTVFTGSVESFKKVIETCPIPVLILGGEKMNNDKKILEIVKDSIEAGGAGVVIVRNIFQHDDPTAMTRAIAKVIHKKSTVDEAFKELRR